MRKIFTFIFSAALLCTSALPATAQEVADSDSTVFNFNGFDPATTPTSNNSHDGDITENKTFTAGDVTLTVTPNPNGSASLNNLNRFWLTSAGKVQLRVYGGSLIFTIPEGENITQLAFYCQQWGRSNTANGEAFTGENRTRAPKFWNGSAQTVTVNIDRNSQIDSVTVKYTKPATSNGITTVKTFKADKEDNRYYNLSGEAVSADTKGILIHDGKKILVK